MAIVGALLAVSLSVLAGSTWSGSAHSLLSIGVPVIGLVVVGLLLTSDRLDVTLAIFMAYLGCVDGAFKLADGSQIATLGRDVILWAILAGWIIRSLRTRARGGLPHGSALVLTWVACILVQIPNPGGGGLAHSLISVRPDIEFVPLFFVGFSYMRTAGRLSGFLLLLLALAAINGIVSLIQLDLTPAQLAAWGPGYSALELGGKAAGTTIQAGGFTYFVNGASHVRPLGLGGFPGFAGVLAILAIPGGLALLSQPASRVPRWVISTLLGLSLLGIATSQTRTAVIGALLVMLAYGVLTLHSGRAARTLVLLAVIGAVGFGIGSTILGNSPNRYSTIAPNQVVGTLTTYKSGTYALIPRYLAQHPLGAGLGLTGAAAGSTIGGGISQSAKYDGETEFTYLIIEGGIPALVVMMALVFWTVRAGLRTRHSPASEETRTYLMAMLSVFAFFVADWFFGNNTTTSPTAPFLWLAMGTFAYWTSIRPSADERV